MGLINALGNLGGYFGPVIVGYLDKETGNFLYGFAALGVGFFVAALLAWLVRIPEKVVPAAGNEG